MVSDMPVILFVDDDESLREVTRYHLEQDGFEVISAENGLVAFELFTKHSPDVVVSDIAMPGMDGIELLNKLKSVSEDTMFIIITAHGSVESAVEAMQIGACDYIEKPFSSDALKLSIRKALRVAELERENRYLRQVAQEKFQFENIVGTSSGMKRVYEVASRVADKNTTVLILGESGTGKELLAKAIHFNSRRKTEPFIAMNMGAIPEHLVDSELFGHEKGAFTGATSMHAGAFERAHRGTLFLDEIAEMRPDHQVRLLRVLQEKEIVRVGGEKAIPVDVRVIAATNKNMERMVEAGEFREDLYYRLSVVPVRIPPLRERADDVPLLISHFLDKHCREAGIDKLSVTSEALKALTAYNWPGNVRELENFIEHSVTMSESGTIDEKCLPERIKRKKDTGGGSSFIFQLPDEGIVLEDVEKSLIEAALRKNDFNQSATARYLGITRNTLLYRLDKYGLK